MEGSVGAERDAVRLAVYWGDTLLNVSQVDDPRTLTAEAVFGAGVGAVGISPQQKLFSKDVSKRATVQFGALTLVAEPIEAPPRVSTLSPPEDYSFFKIAMMTGLAMVAVLVSMALTPHDLPSNEDDILGRTVAIFQPTIAKTVDLRKKTAAAELARAKGEEGVAGPKDAKPDEAPKERNLTRKTKSGADLARELFAGLGNNPVFEAGLTEKIDGALAGIENPNRTIGDYKGFGGMGSRQQGPGGGNKDGLEFKGGVGTKKDGVPKGFGLNGTHRKPEVFPPVGPIHITDGLSKDVIAKVIKRHQSEIKACYEAELQRNPSLSGKVSVSFTIDPTGGVANAAVADSSLESPTAEDCILRRLRAWKFPEPLGGGVVDVNFPWVFSSAGDAAE